MKILIGKTASQDSNLSSWQFTKSHSGTSSHQMITSQIDSNPGTETDAIPDFHEEITPKQGILESRLRELEEAEIESNNCN